MLLWLSYWTYPTCLDSCYNGLTVSIIDAVEMEQSFAQRGDKGGEFGGGTDDQQGLHKASI